MSPALLNILTFFAAALAVVGIFSLLSDLFLRDKSRVSKRVDEEFRKNQRNKVQKSALFKNLEAITESAFDEERVPLWQRLEFMIEQAGMELKARQLLILMGLTGGSVGFIAAVIRQSLMSGLIVGIAVALLPLMVVWQKRKARLEKLMLQLPDAFDLMARVIRAGQTMAQALQAVADEFDPPIAHEFSYCYEQQNLGLPPDLAFRDLARRTGIIEIKIFVLALLVQQQTGGNLAELLDRLAAMIRDRFRIRSKIRALTAEGRLQAIVLLALPPVLLLIILAINTSYGQVLLHHSHLLVGMFIAEALGAVWIRKIVNFDF